MSLAGSRISERYRSKENPVGIIDKEFRSVRLSLRFSPGICRALRANVRQAQEPHGLRVILFQGEFQRFGLAVAFDQNGKITALSQPLGKKIGILRASCFLYGHPFNYIPRAQAHAEQGILGAQFVDRNSNGLAPEVFKEPSDSCNI